MSGRPEASGEQVDAVARVLMGGGEPCEGATSDARAILATDDPHARAALLATATTDELTAALVQRGVPARGLEAEPVAWVTRGFPHAPDSSVFVTCDRDVNAALTNVLPPDPRLNGLHRLADELATENPSGLLSRRRAAGLMRDALEDRP